MLNIWDCEYYQAIKNYSIIMIFGAAENGRKCQDYCKRFGKEISCYLISNKYEMEEFGGVKVKQINKVSQEEKKDGLVIVGRAYENYNETYTMLKNNGFCNIIPGIYQFTCELDDGKIKQLKSIFGCDLIINIPSYGMKECNTKIYSVTSTTNFHKAKYKWNSGYIVYIQAGAALTADRICDITDNTGDNISQYNRYLNETTAGYWIAKNNTENEYLGLYHYGRGMNLSDGQLEWIAEKKVDVVLKTPEYCMYDMLSIFGDREYKAICRFAPDYVDAAETYLKNNFFFQGNIQISKSWIFKEYYEWAIDVIKNMAGMYQEQIKKGDTRLLAYAMERLMNIWYIKNADRFSFAFASPMNLFG